MASATFGVTEVLAIAKELLTLFSEAPFNILVGGMLAGVGFGVLRKGRKTVR